MDVIICKDAAEVGRRSAARIAHLLQGLSRPVLGVATGSSPLATYEDLSRRVAADQLDLSSAHAVALDEYVGLPVTHPESYRATLVRTVVEPLGIAAEALHVPDGMAENPDEAALDYERQIAELGGVDVQLLGIGHNGHIGFNEPASSLASRTRLKTLTSKTREANTRFFSSIDEVPTHCLTQGLGTILDARALVLVAQGEEKADAIAACVEGPVSAMCPASVLQLHPKAWVFVDEGAASKLTQSDYYREIQRQMPACQQIAD